MSNGQGCACDPGLEKHIINPTEINGTTHMFKTEHVPKNFVSSEPVSITELSFTGQ